MNTSVNAPLSRPDLSLYTNPDSKPLDLSLSRLSETIGGNGGGGQSPISFGGPESTSGAAQNPMRLNTDSLNADKTAGTAQGGDNDISKILEKILQLLQELFQMQKPDQGEEGEGGPAPVGKSSGGTPAQAQAQTQPPAGGAGGGGGASPAGGPTGAPPPTQNASVGDAAPSQSVSGTQGTSGLHMPPALARHEGAIGEAAKASGMPANVIAGMIWAESRGNSSASTVNQGNGKADTGVMQVNSATAAAVQSKYSQHFTDDMTPDQKNIMTGALYLKDQYETFGNMDAALRGYNSGPDTVNIKDPSDISKTGWGDPDYVANVNRYAEIIATGKGELPA